MNNKKKINMNTKNLLKTFELCINGKKKKFYSTLLNDEVPSKIEKECDKLEMPELIKKNKILNIEISLTSYKKEFHIHINKLNINEQYGKCVVSKIVFKQSFPTVFYNDARNLYYKISDMFEDIEKK